MLGMLSFVYYTETMSDEPAHTYTT